MNLRGWWQRRRQRRQLRAVLNRVSDQMREMIRLGYDAEEVVGMLVQVVLPPEFEEQGRALNQCFLELAQSIEREVSYRERLRNLRRS